jgi:hypothetical protein
MSEVEKKKKSKKDKKSSKKEGVVENTVLKSEAAVPKLDTAEWPLLLKVSSAVRVLAFAPAALFTVQSALRGSAVQPVCVVVVATHLNGHGTHFSDCRCAPPPSEPYTHPCLSVAPARRQLARTRDHSLPHAVVARIALRRRTHLFACVHDAGRRRTVTAGRLDAPTCGRLSRPNTHPAATELRRPRRAHRPLHAHSVGLVAAVAHNQRVHSL